MEVYQFLVDMTHLDDKDSLKYVSKLVYIRKLLKGSDKLSFD